MILQALRADKNSSCHRFIHKPHCLHVNSSAFVNLSCLNQLQSAGETEIRGAFRNSLHIQMCSERREKEGAAAEQRIAFSCQRRRESSILCTAPRKSLEKEGAAGRAPSRESTPGCLVCVTAQSPQQSEGRPGWSTPQPRAPCSERVPLGARCLSSPALPSRA